MDFFFYNFSWMLFNIFLALIPIVTAFFLRKKLHVVLKILLFVIWFLFFPNTIYIITDLQYLPYQLQNSSLAFQILLIIQYVVLIIIGLIAFIVGFEPFENIVSKHKIKGNAKDFLYIVISFVFAFAVILGKVQRTNSWDMFVDLPRVIRDIEKTIMSTQLLFYVLLFGVVINIIYFLLRSVLVRKILIKQKKRAKKRRA